MNITIKKNNIKNINIIADQSNNVFLYCSPSQIIDIEIGRTKHVAMITHEIREFDTVIFPVSKEKPDKLNFISINSIFA